MYRKINKLDVALNAEIHIARNRILEEYLISRPNNILRPRLTSMPAIRNIPFGVRGRRHRRLMSVMYIGIQANMAETASPAPAQQQPASTWRPARPPSPANRIYRRLTFTPSPDRHMLPASPVLPNDDTTLEIEFIENFGRISLEN